MKLKYIIGILALLLLTVGTASAETFVLNNANDPHFKGKIEIRADCDEAAGTITIQYVSDSVDEDPIGIDMVYYNLDRQIWPVTLVTEGSVDTTNTWTLNFDGEVAAEGESWGTFSSHQCKDGGSYGGITSPIVFTLAEPFSDTGLPANDKGHHVAVHIRYTESQSTWVTDGNGAEIPEFPSIALPVAAVIGIMFVVGSRKKE